MTIKIEVTRTTDSAMLADVHAACFAQRWDIVSLQGMLAVEGTIAVLAYVLKEGDSTPKGFGLLRVIAGEAEILTLAVLPEARGQGVGKSLLSAMRAEAAAQGAAMMFLEVSERNAAACALYEKNGFTRVGLRKDYYATQNGPEHAVVMRADI